ncbi:tRNA-specific adenosine deaminase [Aquisphaera giovannonii]|uniref:tRNA-specific adenosine deaminase n=1 Tax=Aquisphaera giovannonii TaxID=406548 RepID=A0A5B9VWJ6_9BACT|nr:tRNA-specific adenosine deaminase [Aquisphaera giovannonii]
MAGAITGHAETLACQVALDAAGRGDLAGAALDTTAETCFICGYAIPELRVGLVVCGKDAPIIEAVTSAHPVLTDPALDGWRLAPAVIGGELREECEGLKRKPGA